MALNVVPRQLVWVSFKFPHKYGLLSHPAIVVSTASLLEEEGMFYAVLISSVNLHSAYTIPISNEDFIGSDSLDHGSYVVTHFCTYFDNVERVTNAYVRQEKFVEIQDKIIKNVFGIELE